MLRSFCIYVPIRGRHRLADKLGKLIAPAKLEAMNIYGTSVVLDHSLATCRYMYYGVYEENFIRFLKRVVKPRDVIIEPGVNIGYVTAILAGLVGSNGLIIGLEPSKICFEKIKHYLVKDNIILLNKALADKQSISKFVDKEIVISHGYSSLEVFTTTEEKDDVYEIEVESVDRLVDDLKIKSLKLLKLDIEGSELLAVRGAINSISRNIIDYILIEMTFSEINESSNLQLAEILLSNNYLPYMLQRNDLKRVDLMKLKGTRHDIIWTCIEQAI